MKLPLNIDDDLLLLWHAGQQHMAIEIQILREIVAKGSELLSAVNFLKTQGEHIMSKIADLQAAVAASDAVIHSAVVLINGLAQQVKDAGTDPVALAAVIADIEANKDALAAAVAANTPAG